MIMAYERFKNALERGVLKPLYLFSGEERYFKEKIFKEIKNHLGGNGDFSYEEVDGQAVSEEELIARAETVAFWGQRFIIVKNCRFFAGKNDDDLLLNYFHNPSGQTVVIFSTEMVVDKRKKIYKEFLKVGEELEFNSLKEEEVQAVINAWAKKRGFKIEKEAVLVLAQSFGQSLLELKEEFNKLTLYKLNEKEITLQDVLAVCGQDKEISVFYLVEELLAGKINRKKLKEQLINQEEAIKFTGLIAKNLRQIYSIKYLEKKRQTPIQIAQALSLPEWLVQKTLRTMKVLNLEKLRTMLLGLVELDEKIKTGERDLAGLFEKYFLTQIK